jgi:acetylornithine aminotransferase
MTRYPEQRYQERWQAALMDNYGTPALALVRGSGAEVWDAEGNRYLDLVSGVAVNSLGHAHPAVVEAVTSQIQQLGHVSNFFMHEPVLRLAERLQELLEARTPGCCSATRAPRRTRPRSRSLAGPAD